MIDENRKIENYTATKSFQIGGKEIILAEDMQSDMPYMVCNCTWDNTFDIDVYDNIVCGDDYLEILTEFLSRIETQAKQVQAERDGRGITASPLTAADCIYNSMNQDLDGQLVVIRPEHLTPEYRTPDHQLALCTGGNGSRPDARGRAVFCVNIYSGKHGRWERRDILGIVRPDRIPEWAAPKIAQIREQEGRPSIREQLSEGKEVGSKHITPQQTNKKSVYER